MLTIKTMSVQTPQLVGYLLTANRSNFVFVEVSTGWLYDCPQILSPLFWNDKRFDRLPIYYQHTVMLIDLIPRQTFVYATLYLVIAIHRMSKH